MKFICEDCNNVFNVEEEKLSKIFNPDCPQCGSSDTTEPGKVVEKLTDYEASQETSID